MLSVSNSQIGERLIGTLPSVFRAICMNGCIWDRTLGKAFRRRHRGEINLDDLFLSIKENLDAQIPLLPQGINKLLGTKKLRWDGASIKPLFAEVADEYKLTKKQATAALTAYHTEVALSQASDRSLFGVINSITRAGQESDYSAQWVEMDVVGGRLAAYDQNDWNRLTSRAKALKVKEVEDAFISA